MLHIVVASVFLFGADEPVRWAFEVQSCTSWELLDTTVAADIGVHVSEIEDVVIERCVSESVED